MLRHGDTLGCSLKNERASRSLTKTGRDIADFFFTLFWSFFCSFFLVVFWRVFGLILGAFGLHFGSHFRCFFDSKIASFF